MHLKRNPARRSFAIRRRVLTSAVGAMFALAMGVSQAVTREPMQVVATFSILADMVKEIGGERVTVSSIVGPNADSHRFEPSPGEARTLQNASVLVLNGLDFELWLPRLVEASGFKGRQVLASEGVKLRRLQSATPGTGQDHSHDDAGSRHDADGSHHHGDTDPHAWQDLSNGVIYARNIAAGLAKADPRNASYYQGRAASYIARMKTLDNEIRQAIAAIPPERRRVITTHDAFGYFGDAYGIEFIPVSGFSNQAEPSAADVARIITIAREQKVGGVFIENMSNSLLAQQIAREGDVLMGGTLYADALGPPDQPAATYLGMLSWNAGRLLYVLKKAAE